MLQRENFLSTQNVDAMIDHEDMIKKSGKKNLRFSRHSIRTNQSLVKQIEFFRALP